MGKVADHVKKYRSRGYTCAESTIMAANEAWELGLSEESTRLFGGFGGGMHSGNICGAVSAGVAALSARYNKGSGHTSPMLAVKCNLFLQAVQEGTGCLRCDELKPVYATKEEGCDPTVVLIARILDDVEAVPLDIPENAGYDLRNPPEGKPGFKEFNAAAKAQYDAYIRSKKA